MDSRSQVYTTTAYFAQQFEGEPLTLVASSDGSADLTGDGLTDLYITNLERRPETHFFVNAHTTAPYQAAQFGATPIAFDLHHHAIDLNGNGLYDQLVISATVAAILPEGDYDWSGQLVGPTGVAVGMPITGSGQLYPGKRITFAVYSPPLRQANLDGAYSLQNVVITHRDLPTTTVAIPLLYTSAALPGRPVPVNGKMGKILRLKFTEMYATISSGNHCYFLHKLSMAPGWRRTSPVDVHPWFERRSHDGLSPGELPCHAS